MLNSYAPGKVGQLQLADVELRVGQPMFAARGSENNDEFIDPEESAARCGNTFFTARYEFVVRAF